MEKHRECIYCEIKSVLQEALEEEITNELGYSRYWKTRTQTSPGKAILKDHQKSIWKYRTGYK